MVNIPEKKLISKPPANATKSQLTEDFRKTFNDARLPDKKFDSTKPDPIELQNSITNLESLLAKLSPAPRSWIDPKHSPKAPGGLELFSHLKPIPIAKLCSDNPKPKPPLVEGLLRRGEVCNIIAGPKLGKSFLAHGIGWSVATGKEWLGRKTYQGKVLIIDNELHPETLAERLKLIASRLQVNIESDMLDVIPLRGNLCDIKQMEQFLGDIPQGEYSLMIIDALYRALPSGTNENDNAGVTEVFNQLDKYAQMLDCAIIVIHHASKGNQAAKNVTDVGSGAGAMSRAADVHLIIREGKESKLAVIDAVCRNAVSPEPISVRFNYPLWQLSTENPSLKTSRYTGANNDEAGFQKILDFIGDKTVNQQAIIEHLGRGVHPAQRLLDMLIGSEKIELIETPPKTGTRMFKSYRKFTSSGTSSGRS